MNRTFVLIKDIRGNQKYLMVEPGIIPEAEAKKLAIQRCGEYVTTDKIYYDVETNV